MSKPDDGKTGGDAAASTGTRNITPPSVIGASYSWADETTAANTNLKPSTVEANAEKEMSSLAQAQTDGGATPALNGSSGLYEPSYEVDVQLSDLQKQSGNPLASIKSFEELGL